MLNQDNSKNGMATVKRNKTAGAFDDGYKVIDLDRIRVHLADDGGYQRALDEHHVSAIVANFDPQQVRPISVVYRGKGHERPDGFYYAVDGQHTCEALRRIGRQAAYCHVLDAPTVAEEAALFHALNTTPKAVNALDKFRARVAAKDEAALRIDGIVRSYGLRISGDKIVGCVGAVVALEQVHQRTGNLAAVLRVINAWQSGDPYAFDGVFITDVSAFLAEYPAASETTLIRQLKRYTPKEIKQIAKRYKVDLGGTRQQNGVRAIRQIYNEKLRKLSKV